MRKVALLSPDSTPSQLYVDFTTLRRRVSRVAETTLDFLLVGAVVYAIDKLETSHWFRRPLDPLSGGGNSCPRTGQMELAFVCCQRLPWLFVGR